ncbi:MAG TPA: hypothetical protein VIL45_07080 [Thermoplasmata archaeon]
MPIMHGSIVVRTTGQLNRSLRLFALSLALSGQCEQAAEILRLAHPMEEIPEVPEILA